MALAEDGGHAPYAPPSAIINIIDAYRDRGLRTPFDLDVLVQAGVTEALAPRVRQSLQLLDLVDEGGNPTQELQDLRRAPSAEFQDRFASILRAAYAPIFQFVDPAADPPERLQDAFRVYEPAGQRGRMVTLYLGLCTYAGIIEETSKRAPAESPTRRSSSRGPRQERQRRTRATKEREAPVRSSGKVPAAIVAFLEELPDQEDGWTQAQRDRFLTTLATLLDYSFPIQQGGVPTPSPTDESDE